MEFTHVKGARMSKFEEVERALWGTGSYKIVRTSFGLELLFFIGSDDLLHTLVDPDHMQGRLTAPYDHELMVLSHRRMREVCRLADEAEREMREGDDAGRLPSVTYEPSPEVEARFKHFEWNVDGIELCEEQINAIKHILSSDKRVSVLTGPAGTGKSLMVRWLVANSLATITATTGKVAIADDGITVDSLFCIDRDTWEVFNWKLMERNMRQSHSLIVIDEASMCGLGMCDMLLNIAEKMGKRLLLVGDFAQAAPVKDEWGNKSRMFQDIDFICLSESHRQDEQVFLSVLNKIRRGVIDQEVHTVLSSRAGPCPDDDGWIRMFATNRLTNEYNDRRLNMHCKQTGNDPFTVHAIFTDNRSQPVIKSRPRSASFINDAINNTSFSNGNRLAVGAQLLFCANEQPADRRRYVNGDTGVLQDVAVYVEKSLLNPEKKKGDEETAVVVSEPPKIEQPVQMDDAEAQQRGLKLVWLTKVDKDLQHVVISALCTPGRLALMSVVVDRTEEKVTIRPVDKEVKNGEGRVIHTITGFPVKAGWACTIHKSQGMTVDNAWFDMGSIRCMPEQGRHGLAYVGLSRVRTLKGLRISEWAPDTVYCDPQVKHLI